MRLDIASLSMAILWNIIFISVVFVMEKEKGIYKQKRNSNNTDILFIGSYSNVISC